MRPLMQQNGLRPQPPSNRDLSEQFTGTLEITIYGIGTKKEFFNGDSLAAHVAAVHRSLKKPSFLVVGDERNAPWEIVSFDRLMKTLVVRPVH